MRNRGVYAIFCNGKIYIGSSNNINSRWTVHKWYLKNNTHQNVFLQREWNKHGIEAFEFVILEQVNDLSNLRIREQLWIDEMKRAANTKEIFFNSVFEIGNPCLFNRLQGVYSDERRKKHSEMMRNNQFAKNKSHPQSKETREKIAASLKGKKHTESSKQKQSEKMKGRAGVPSKLTAENVIDIRCKRQSGMSSKNIAVIHGVSKDTINKIVSFKSWSHLKQVEA
jgi:group I intron endonuclease